MPHALEMAEVQPNQSITELWQIQARLMSHRYVGHRRDGRWDYHQEGTTLSPQDAELRVYNFSPGFWEGWGEASM
jgi:hypothetical protein